jgi:hypothetical protein
MSNTGIINFVFHNQSTETGNGSELSINSGMTTLNFEISGTATSSTCIFEGKSVDDGVFYPIQCVKLSDLTLASQTTGKGELWQCDLTALIKFRVRISVIAGGNISVKGRAVN